MKKYSLFLFAVTAVCIIVGLVYNYKSFEGIKYINSSKMIKDEVNFGNVEVKEVKIDMDHGDISFAYGSELTVSSLYLKEDLPKVTYENGVLSVIQKIPVSNYVSVRHSEDEYLTKVTIPEGTVIKKIESVSNNCDAYLENIDAEDVTFKQSTGDVDIKGCKFQNLIADCQDGDFYVSGEFANVDIKLENDDVTLSGKLDQVKVDVINGDIELNTEGPIDLNKVSVNTLNGNLYINGKEIGD